MRRFKCAVKRTRRTAGYVEPAAMTRVTAAEIRALSGGTARRCLLAGRRNEDLDGQKARRDEHISAMPRSPAANRPSAPATTSSWSTARPSSSAPISSRSTRTPSTITAPTACRPGRSGCSATKLYQFILDGAVGIKPTHLAIVFDKSEQTFRKEIYADYKAHRREPPDDLMPQFPLMREAVKAFGLDADREGGLRGRRHHRHLRRRGGAPPAPTCSSSPPTRT